MNPLSYLFRAVDTVARRLLLLRAVPGTLMLALRSLPAVLRGLPSAARGLVPTLRAQPWREYARTAADRAGDPWWWRRGGLRGAEWVRRSWRVPARRGLGMAVLAAVAVGVAVTTATLTTAPDHPTQAAGYDSARVAPDRADRGQARTAPSPDAKAPDAKAPAGKAPAGKAPAPAGKAPAAKAPAAKPKPPAEWQLPVAAKHYWVSSTFGTRWGVLHAGVDLAVPMNTPIHAAHAGSVSIAGAYDGYGNAVGLENGNDIATVYGHLSRVVVHTGDHVRAGQLIGFSGNTGDSTGPHLHFEMRRHGVAFDPLPYLTGHGLDIVRNGGKG
ncbi:M23 family metallopeptidase [Actinocatenispora rupis]|uniref:M23ase beta-sheet core domain-containing protein n=1 Tax=Actinocatenispora rupis TaxID=519421 RepID=A0A8J3NBJ2_9ACTN|nr:M23 family metallopeptidase [Actinocatenispora rupis]GID10850.1 hypothetical protein Aru02nite_17390 [Actinocatenispora rupis]